MKTNSSAMCTTNARQQSQLGALFVDVRELCDARVLAFDAPEVINLPLSQLAQRWQELPQDRELVLVCQNGDNSAEASEFLRSQGLAHVSPMRGGILLWMQKGYTVIGKRFNAIDKEQEP